MRPARSASIPTATGLAVASALFAVAAISVLATPAVSDAQPRTEEAYVLLARQTVHIAAEATINGSVGVNDARGRAKVGIGSVMAAGTEVVAARLSLGSGSKTFDVYGNVIRFKPAGVIISGSIVSPIPAPVYVTEPLVVPDPFDPANYPAAFPISCGGVTHQALPGQTVSVGPGTYEDLDARGTGKLVLSAGTYTVCELTVLGDLEATGPVTINIANRFSLGQGATLTPSAGGTANDIQINFGGRKSVKFGKNATFSGRIFAPKANMKIGAGAVVTGHVVVRRLGCSGRFTLNRGPTVVGNNTCGDGTVADAETCDPPGAPQPPNQNVCTAGCTFCGDGLTQAGEECDDGNSDNADACSNSCRLTPPPLCGNDTLDPGETCDPPGGDPGAPGGNVCRTDCTYCGDAAVDSGEECDDGNTDSGDSCRNDCTLPPPPSCGNDAIDAGETCDPPGSDPDPAGGNLCRLGCTYCGDGTADAGEECDDGNDVDGDSCRNDCTVPEPPTCGNDTLDGGETCDPPGSDPGAPGGSLCRVNCTYCGDATAQAGEDCDDGNTNDDDACANDCTLNQPPTCGNGSMDPGETCDPPGTDPLPVGGNLCRTSCTYCGDGAVNADEVCDDGNDVDGDSCRNDCTLNVAPSCGDGELNQLGETCDPPGSDPFPIGGSLCRGDCTYCGDGEVAAGEACDDANDDDGDACRNDCSLPLPAACIVDVEKSASPDEIVVGASAPNCNGKVEALTFRYTGEGCGATTNTQEGKASCSGDADFEEPVRIRIREKRKANNVYGDTPGVFLDGTASATAAAGGKNEFGAETIIEIRDAGDTIIEELEVHTSCSKDLDLGDRFGSLELVSLTSTEDGEQNLGESVTYSYAVVNVGSEMLTSISVVDDKLGEVPGSPVTNLAPGASVVLTTDALISETTINLVVASATAAGGAICDDSATATVTEVIPPQPPAACDGESKVSEITLTYTGAGCGASDTPQEGKAVCTGDANFTAPVRIQVRDKGDAGIVYGDESGLPLGGSVTGTAADGGEDKFKAATLARIFDTGGALVEENEIHTSCSKDLAVGDNCGSLEVTGLVLIPK